MKNIVFILLVISSLFTYSQIINCNPDPNGDPWVAGGSPTSITGDYQLQVDEIQEMVLNPGRH